MDIEQGVHAYVCRVEYVRVQYASVSISTMLHKTCLIENKRSILPQEDQYYVNNNAKEMLHVEIICMAMAIFQPWHHVLRTIQVRGMTIILKASPVFFLKNLFLLDFFMRWEFVSEEKGMTSTCMRVCAKLLSY